MESVTFPVGAVHGRGAGAARSALHEPRPAGLRARQPAGDGQGRAVRPLLPLRRHAAPALPRRVRRLAARDPVVELAARASARAKLYETIFLGYGDDSVAQLGGAHIACEWTSNLLTKILQRPRLAAYLEQSTRYIAYDAQLDDLRLPLPPRPAVRPAYEAAMDELFATYSALLEGVSAWVDDEFPRGDGGVAGGAPARRAGEGARPRSRHPSGGVALARGDLRDRPDVRAARPPPARASACRGARVRRDAARGAAAW